MGYLSTLDQVSAVTLWKIFSITLYISRRMLLYTIYNTGIYCIGVCCRWYFPDMSRERAELVLKEDGREGVFLVRKSNISDCYTVGIFTKEVGKKNNRGETLGTVRHYHIKVVKDDKGYVIGTRSSLQYNTTHNTIQ